MSRVGAATAGALAVTWVQMASHAPKPSQENQSEVATKERTKTRRPVRYKVLLHNDDFTTMEFVIEVLMLFFEKDATDAMRIMLLVHLTGTGLCGVYTREIAETKVSEVTEYARANEYPLRCSMEPQ